MMEKERKRRVHVISMEDWMEDRERQQKDERQKGGALWNKH